MKVLHVIKVAGLGGAEVYLTKILPAMNQAGIESTLLAMINPNALDKASSAISLMRSLGINVIEIIVKSDFSWSMYKQMSDIIKEGKYDLVNTHLIHSELYTGMVKRLFIRNLKIINTRHGYYPAYQVKYGFEPTKSWKDKFWWLYKFNKGTFNRTISISHGLKNLLVAMNLAKPEDVDVIHYGFDYDEVKYNKNPNQFRKAPQQLIIIGRLEPVKGHTFAFQALPKILTQFPDLKLIIVGTGYYEDNLKKEVEEKGLAKHIEFLGFQTAVHDFLKNSDVTLIPSFAEGFCAVVLESNNNHTPVVCFDVPALNEIIDNEKTGIIVPKFDVDKFSDKIIELLDNQDKSKQITKAAFHKLNTYFTMDRMLKETIKVYERVISES